METPSQNKPEPAPVQEMTALAVQAVRNRITVLENEITVLEREIYARTGGIAELRAVLEMLEGKPASEVSESASIP